MRIQLLIRYMTSRGLTLAGFGNLVRPLLAAAGLREADCCHLFHHACATHMLEREADIRVIQQLLGHAGWKQFFLKCAQESHDRIRPSFMLGRSRV